MKYICKQSFSVRFYDDDDGFLDEFMTVEHGSVWKINECDERIIGGAVALDEDGGSRWLEISNDHLEEYFELYKGQEEAQ